MGNSFLVEILTAALAAFAVCGVVLLLARLTGRKLPRKAVPLIAAVVLSGTALYMRQGWEERVRQSLPPGMVVVAAWPHESVLEPWTAWFPRNSRLLVLNRGGLLDHPEHPGIRVAELALFEHYAPTLTSRHFLDCPARRTHPLDETAGPLTPPPPDAPGWRTDGLPAALFAEACPVAAPPTPAA